MGEDRAAYRRGGGTLFYQHHSCTNILKSQQLICVK